MHSPQPRDSSFQIGYCTNVHAGADLSATRENLERHAVAVREAISADQPLNIGLWLSASSAESLLAERRIEEFANWLEGSKLVPFTMNGFPFGDFHREVVKHDVYLPTWCEPTRAQYTRNLIRILDRLLPEGQEASISTLPLFWGLRRDLQAPREVDYQLAAANLRALAEDLRQLELEHGRLISLCLEPEPGCALQRSQDVVSFYEEYLLSDGVEDTIRRHIRVCHDVCHAVVMFEEQADVFCRYAEAGIEVGKVQISSAICFDPERVPAESRADALRQLAEFSEDRYLHQTMIGENGTPRFYEDLPSALEAWQQEASLESLPWRVHFHVPVYLEAFGLLHTSRQQIWECLEAARRYSGVRDFEVETYAWGVLPAELRQTELATGIAKELEYVRELAVAEEAESDV